MRRRPGVVPVALQQGLDRDARAAHQPDDAAGLLADLRTHAIGRVVDAVDRGSDGMIDALGLLP